jgi:hypothetical protein
MPSWKAKKPGKLTQEKYYQNFEADSPTVSLPFLRQTNAGAYTPFGTKFTWLELHEVEQVVCSG